MHEIVTAVVSIACVARRKDENGVLVFALAARGDLPRAWVNPYTAMGPVGAMSLTALRAYMCRDEHSFLTHTNAGGIMPRRGVASTCQDCSPDSVRGTCKASGH